MLFRLQKKEIELPKPNKKPEACISPTVENYAVRQLEFFMSKHHSKNNKQLHKPEDLDALAKDIFWVAQCILYTKEIVELHCKLRQIIKKDMEDRDSIRHINFPIVRHLEFVEKLRDFHDFHVDRGGSVQDKRVTYLIALRMKVKMAITFLKNRSKDIYKKNE